MVAYYAFERLAGKLEYEVGRNCITGNRSIKGRLLVFSSIHRRSKFIQTCPDELIRQEIKHCEVRSLFLGMPIKELEALLVALSVDAESAGCH